MATDPLSQFLDHLYQSQLLQPSQIEELIRRPEMPTSDVDSVGAFLEQRGWLTRFQIDHIKQGRVQELQLTGGYRLTDLVAESPAATIYKAYQLALQRFVILRHYRTEWLAPLESANDFLAQVHAITLVSHPHLVNALDSGTLHDRPYVSTEFVDGVALGTFIRAMGPMPLVLACDYIMQAAMGLRAGHERGIYHGDLSPERLIISPVQRGELLLPGPGAFVKVADVGLVPLRPPISQWPFESALLDIAYLPPERFTDGRPTARGDVYSLGAVMYHALSGQLPFEANSLPEAIQKLQTAEPAPLESRRSDVPPELARLLRAMLSKSAEFRPDLADVIETLRPLAGSQSTAKAIPPTVNAHGVPLASLTGTTLESIQLSPAPPPELPLAGAISDVIVEAKPIYSPAPIPVAEVIVDDSATPVAHAIPMQGYTPGVQPTAYPNLPRAEAFEPSHDHHPDLFNDHGHHEESAEESPRAKKKESGNWLLWAILGGMLHITAVGLLAAWALGAFDPSPEPAKPTTPNKPFNKYPKAPRT